MVTMFKSTLFCYIPLLIFQTGQSNGHYYINDFKSNSFERYQIQLKNDTFMLLQNFKRLYNSYTELLQRDPVGVRRDFKSVGTTKIGQRTSKTCRDQLELMLEAIATGEEWALKMIDAAGKPRTGLLEGEVKWYGSYDECVNTRGEAVTNGDRQIIRGQYCTLYFPLDLGDTVENPFEAVADVFGVLGICLPDSCSELDATSLANSILKKASIGNLSLTIIDTKCERSAEIDRAAIVAISILGVLVLLVIIGTLYDVFYIQLRQKPKTETDVKLPTTNGHEKDPLVKKPSERQQFDGFERGLKAQILQSFSVYTNGKKLLNTNTGSGDLGVIHGLRFLSSTWIILFHMYTLAAFFAGNGLFITDLVKRWTIQVVTNSVLPVDTFFVISGFLLSYTNLKKSKKKSWFKFYFHRFWRLTPSYMLVMMVYTTLLGFLGNGPLWHINKLESDKCKDSWWQNLLYINDFQDPEDICMIWSWYLSAEMLYYVISPIMLVPLSRFKSAAGLIPCFVLLLGSFVTIGVLSSMYNMPPSVIGGGEDPSALMDYLKWFYFKPFTRMAPYIIGIILGYILWRTKRKVKINKYLNLAAWALATGVACTIIYGLTGPMNGAPLSRDVSALYNATHKTLWAVCVSWVIFACLTGNGGFVNTLLSWRLFIPLSRMSYCLYLVHPVVLLVYYGSMRSPFYMNDHAMIYQYLGNVSLSTMVAFVTTLIFELPLLEVEDAITKRIERP